MRIRPPQFQGDCVTTSEDLRKLSPIGLGEFQLSRLNRAANSRKQLYETLSSIIEDLADARLAEIVRDGRKSRMPELRRADEAQRIPAATEREIRRRRSFPVQDGHSFHHGLRADRGSGRGSQNGEFKGSRIVEPRRAAQRKGGSVKMAEEPKQRRASKRSFMVVIPRDTNLLEVVYRGQDRGKASEAVEKALTRSQAKGEKNIVVQALRVGTVQSFMLDDLQLRLTDGL